MQHILPIRLAKSVNLVTLSVTKLFRTLLLASGLLIVFSMQANAQDSVIYQEWDHLAERSTLVDVSTRVLSCNGEQAVVHVMIFNENAMDQTVTFTVTLESNGSKESFTYENYSIGLATMHRPECGSDENSNLVIQVPEGFDPATMKLTAKFKED